MSEPCSQEIVLSQDYTEFLTVALSITPELLNLDCQPARPEPEGTGRSDWNCGQRN